MIIIARKGKYLDWIEPDGLLRVEGWAREGLNDEQIARNIGVSIRQFYDWQNRFPQFAQALKKGKVPVDLEVENALLKRALGYDYEETTTEIYKDPGGQEHSHIKKTKKHMPPDTTAQIFWLKNRRPGRWRDKIEGVSENPNELLQAFVDAARRQMGND